MKPARKSVRWKLSDLMLTDYNPRKISPRDFRKLKESLRMDPDFLELRPILVNVAPARRGMVIAGHQRVAAARELGWDDIPCCEVEATAAEEKKMNVRDNVHSGEFDDDKLADLVAADPGSFEGILSDDKLDSLMGMSGDVPGEHPGGAEGAVDEIAAMPDPVTRPGDTWELGDHVLTCGDSTDPATFSRILKDGEKAVMCFTDPPYNVNYGDTMKDAARGPKHRKIANDNLCDEAWRDFLLAFLSRIRENVRGAVYVCMSTKEWATLHYAFAAVGLRWSTDIAWVKDSFTIGRGDYQQQHEPIKVGRADGKSPDRNAMATARMETIMYARTPEGRRKWNGGRGESNVWYFKRPRKSPIHPTQKPVELVLQAVRNSSHRGDLVLDCFAGGGSTLIACERSSRRSRLVELDPGYCDAIVSRYVGHTKNHSLKLNGKPHEWKGPVITIEGVLDSPG